MVQSKFPDLFTTTLVVANIHCPSCVSYATDVLSPFSASITNLNISIIEHTIRIQHTGDISRRLTEELLKAAFEVEHVSVEDQSGKTIRSEDVKSRTTSPPQGFFSTLFMSRAQKQHVRNCNVCQEDEARRWPTKRRLSFARRGTGIGRRSLSTDVEARTVAEDSIQLKSRTPSYDVDSITDRVQERHTANLSIEGMTCASCVAAITDALQQEEYIITANVNLVANNASVTFAGPAKKASAIKDIIEDIGYEAEISDVQALKRDEVRSDLFRASLAIEGMTCGSCVGNVSQGLRELDFVQRVDVDLVSNGASVTFHGRNNINNILERISDLGYDAQVVNIEDFTTNSHATSLATRSIQISLTGMYCPKCPVNIVDAIHKQFSDAVTITTAPTLQNPRLGLTYRPSLPEVSIRRIVDTINSVDSACSASIYHPPTLEQRTGMIQRKERNRILRHLLITAIAAIPSFIIGVVYMSVVTANNPTRQWFEKPIWAGNAIRSDWAMFIMTTPVMFYGASIFHIRALKQIWNLWRPNSKIPILRRFYRFGSMNLLMSAGTSVAYFASLAVLIMDATSPRIDHQMGRKTSTYFDTVTFLTLFILIGRFLEAYSKAKTGDAVSMLANLRPTSALLVTNVSRNVNDGISDNTTRISVDLLELDDVVLVPHGAAPPTDGVIVEDGSFLFDESSLTGESRPAKKTVEDQVFTGTTNVGNPVKVRVTELGGKSMLDQIVNVVRDGQAKRAPIERLADTLTGYFTPVITLIAVCTWIIWLALGESGALPRGWLDVGNGGWPYWSVEFAVAVFVVACPCGIGLAAPTALFVGSGLAAKSGILVQGGGEAFQEASKLQAVVFDKTGTLTEGRMKVTGIEFMRNHELNIDRSVTFAMVEALESASTHPIAKAIVQNCEDATDARSSDLKRSFDIKEIPGQGMWGRFEIQSGNETETYEAMIGNERMLKGSLSHGDSTDGEEEKHKAVQNIVVDDLFLSSILSNFQKLGNSTAIFAIRSRSFPELPTEPYVPIAVFGIADPLRSEAREVLDALRSRGLDVYMCTGDHPQTAQAVASQLRIPQSHIRAGVLPQGKASFIQELQNNASKRTIVAFVGDGTNDTPALTAADVSIALSHPEGGGSDIALTSSSFVLLNSELGSILTLVQLSRRVFLRVKLNFLWAAMYNICLIPVAAGVFFPIGATWGENAHSGFRLNPVWASVAMAGSSISVILSSLALKLPEIEMKRISWRKN